jgi:predicted nucleic acid-binding protein
MRVVADTNIVVSGLMWLGNPRKILDLARVGDIKMFTTAPLLRVHRARILPGSNVGGIVICPP